MDTPFTYKFPKMEEDILSSNHRVLWVEDHTFPVVTMSMQIPIGHLHDPYFKEGTAELTAECMLKGTRSLSGDAFTERFERAGAMLFAHVKGEYSLFGVRILKQKALDIVPLFWNMVVNPAFEEVEFNRLKKEYRASLQAEFADPTAIAGKHFVAQLFQENHPEGRPQTEKTLKHISIDDVRSFYQSFYKVAGGIVVLAGAMRIRDMKEVWAYLFADWPKTGSSRSFPAADAPAFDREENMIRIIDKPELTQTTLMIGHEAVREEHPFKMRLSIANFILGGGNFSSRLMARIRSETGRTYGIASQLISQSKYGVFHICTATRNEQLYDVINSIMEVYATFTEKGPTEEEVEKAKQFSRGNIAFELEGLNNVVEKLLWLRYYDRSNDYFESMVHRIDEIKKEDIAAALQSDFKKNHFVIVAVGRKKEIIDPIRCFGDIAVYKQRENPW